MRISKDELQKYVDAKMSQRAIAEKTGIPEPTIAWSMKRYGIESKLKPKPKESKQTLEKMYLDQGLSISEIAKRLNRSGKSIQRWLSEYGIKTRPVGTNQSGQPLSHEEFSAKVAAFGHEVLSKYRGVDSRVKYRCKCGSESVAFAKSLLRGSSCRLCAYKQNGIARRVSEDKVKACVADSGDVYVDSYYENGYLRLKYICAACKNLADVMFQNYRKGQKCGGCRKLQSSGENNPNWNPNLSDDERGQDGRYDEGYSAWARRVKKRDGFLCQSCHKKCPGRLVSHHLESYASNPDLRTCVDNGVTLCQDCHKEFHALYGYGNNTKQQFLNYLKQR